MKNDLPEVCCGRCKWWDEPGHPQTPVGLCMAQVPDAIIWKEARHKMLATDGTHCPAFARKEDE